MDKVLDAMKSSEKDQATRIAHDLVVAIGSDNIHDVYKPFSTGDMKTEIKINTTTTTIKIVPPFHN